MRQMPHLKCVTTSDNLRQMFGEMHIFSLRCFQCNAIGWTFPSELELERDRNQTAQDVQSPWSKKSWCEWRSFRSFSQMQFVTCTCLFADVKILRDHVLEIKQFPAVSVETVGHGMTHCV